MVLDSGAYSLHPSHDITNEGSLHSQLESLATEQFIGHHVPVELSSKFGDSMGRSDGGVVEGGGGGETSADMGENFRNIPESQSISRTISPITGLSANEQLFPQEKTY